MGGLPGPITYLYSAEGRVAAAHFQRQNRVQWIDGGAYLQNDRGVLAAPRIIGGMSDSVPAHGNYAGNMLSAFFDGSGNVRTWRESDLAAGNLQRAVSLPDGGPGRANEATVHERLHERELYLPPAAPWRPGAPHRGTSAVTTADHPACRESPGSTRTSRTASRTRGWRALR